MSGVQLSDADLARLADMVAERLRPLVASRAAVDPLLTKAELADYLRVEKAQVDRWVRQGMPRETIGSSPRFDLAACRAWLASNAKPRAAVASNVTALRNMPGVTPIGRARRLG